ncbi:MAG: hypothetical protein ABH861_02845 [Patescibacteria group bacterium]
MPPVVVPPLPPVVVPPVPAVPASDSSHVLPSVDVSTFSVEQ